MKYEVTIGTQRQNTILNVIGAEEKAFVIHLNRQQSVELAAKAKSVMRNGGRSKMELPNKDLYLSKSRIGNLCMCFVDERHQHVSANVSSYQYTQLKYL